MFNRSVFRYGAFVLLVAAVDYRMSQHFGFKNTNRELRATISSHRGYGTHYVTIMVGKPPQLLRLAVATGSDYTSFPCQGCVTCTEPRFDFSAESVHRCPSECLFSESTCEDGQDKCRVAVSYSASDDLRGEGYKGFEVSDFAFVDTSSEIVKYHPDVAEKDGFMMHFICQEEIMGGTMLSDGFLGMSTSPLSFVHQLYNAKKIHERVFSLCFRQFDDYQPSGSSAGHVTLGHVDRDLLDSPLVWASNGASLASTSSYVVHIRRVYLGVGGKPDVLRASAAGTMSMMPIGEQDGQPLVNYEKTNGKSGHVLVQTNQPISYLDSSLEEAFTTAFFALTGVKYTAPSFSITEKQFQKLPTVFMQIEAHNPSHGPSFLSEIVPGLSGRHDPKNPYDVLLAVPPEHYVVFLDGLAFPTILFGSQSSLGANVFQNHEVVFDLDNTRIGLAERHDCPEGMSMMAPLLAISGKSLVDPARSAAGSSARSDGGSTSPVVGNEIASEDFAAGVISSNGTTILPGDRDFVLANNSNGNHSQGALNFTAALQGSSSNEENNSTNLFSASENDTHKKADESIDQQSGRIAGDAPQRVGSENSLPLNGELDESGISHSDEQSIANDRKKGRMFSDHSAVVPSGSEPLTERHSGLPSATISSGAKPVRIGPGAIRAAQVPDGVRPTKGKMMDAMSLLGFLLFCVGFTATVLFTQEGENSFYAYVSSRQNNSSDDAETAAEAWQKGQSFYNKTGDMRFVKVQATSSLSRKGWFRSGKRASDESTIDESYSRGSHMYKNLDEQSYAESYFTRGDKTTYTTSTGYERPYYDRSVRNFDQEADENTTGSRSLSSRSGTRAEFSQSRRPYYDLNQSQRPYYDHSKSGRSIYSDSDASSYGFPLKSTTSKSIHSILNSPDDASAYSYPVKSGGNKSISSESDDASYTSHQKGVTRPFFEDYDQSRRDLNRSIASFMSADDEEEYYPKKADLTRFIKPVSTDDRSVFTKQSPSVSVFSRAMSASRSFVSRQSWGDGQNQEAHGDDYTFATGDDSYNVHHEPHQRDNNSRSSAMYARKERVDDCTFASGDDATFYDENYAQCDDREAETGVVEAHMKHSNSRGKSDQSFLDKAHVRQDDNITRQSTMEEQSAYEGTANQNYQPPSLTQRSIEHDDYSDVESFYMD